MSESQGMESSPRNNERNDVMDLNILLSVVKKIYEHQPGTKFEKEFLSDEEKDYIYTRDPKDLHFDRTALKMAEFFKSIRFDMRGYENEILLRECPNRYVLFPIENKDLWFQSKNLEKSIWSSDAIDLKQDIIDWVSLPEKVKLFISHILAFFASADGIVIDNILNNLANEIESKECKQFYCFQMANEAVHSEMYSTLIDTLITDTTEKYKLLNAVRYYPCIKKKNDWAAKWMDPLQPVTERLIAFVIVEGLFFSGSFAAIHWLKRTGKMKGLIESNEYISRDEGLHTSFACKVYAQLTTRLQYEVVLEILEEAVLIEKEFLTSALPVDLIGMNCEGMKQYIEFVADTLLVDLGYKKRYMTPNPFDFMKDLSMFKRSNYYETHNTEYSLFPQGSFSMDAVF
uniref:ribonucleoside-diphosphate reductase n=1 Tax=Chionoecetes opilio bacilliform virus TaxID=1825681 RepID=A0A1Q3DKU1_9VIRU|nr:ribonucleotide reductase small subunit [Chionoecetes opilio bacilliform virus]